MSPPGRKRKPDPTIPAHIDHAALPRGLYWDRSGSGRWFVLEEREGRPGRVTVATRNAKLSELHTIMEERAGVDRGSVHWLLEQFHKSAQFAELMPRTRANYEYLCGVVERVETRIGKLGTLRAAKLTPAFLQRLLDTMAKKTPTQANQAMRYLRRAFSWGIARGYATANPVVGVELAKERRRRRLPSDRAVNAMIDHAKARGALQAHTAGSCAPYLWIAIELAYLCRLRGIEVVTLTDAHALEDGVLTNRRKGSRDSLVRWTPRLRAAWDAATAYRRAVIEKHSVPVPLRAEDRTLLVSEQGRPLKKSSLDTAWQRLVKDAMSPKVAVITAAERFSLHDLKRKGITDTPGTRAEKQLASGHKSESMLDVYDQSVPVVDPAPG